MGDFPEKAAKIPTAGSPPTSVCHVPFEHQSAKKVDWHVFLTPPTAHTVANGGFAFRAYRREWGKWRKQRSGASFSDLPPYRREWGIYGRPYRREWGIRTVANGGFMVGRTVANGGFVPSRMGENTVANGENGRFLPSRMGENTVANGGKWPFFAV
ncbi:hypothetical protein [Deinococcus wulumuqiensis]|uniref:hypothetical protein n=1 Tax=Deinococcus wulumuqiensis TaxID=980427 RepID=UPI00178C2558|nr:hypothetical protein [Deinococcus wulumuqiensis]